MFSFTIDHAAFITQLETWWAMFNPGGITEAMLNLVSGVAIVIVVVRMAKRKKDDASRDQGPAVEDLYQ